MREAKQVVVSRWSSFDRQIADDCGRVVVV